MKSVNLLSLLLERNMTEEHLDPYGLKHRAVFLLPYEDFDGPYASESQCKFLSVGWAQYNPRVLSVKTLRHTGDRWSRQSEEIPVHRVIDMAILLAHAVSVSGEHDLRPIEMDAETFEHQGEAITILPKLETMMERGAFARELNCDLLKRRLGKLRDVLNLLHARGSI
jgi:hypothetical protein